MSYQKRHHKNIIKQRTAGLEVVSQCLDCGEAWELQNDGRYHLIKESDPEDTHNCQILARI